jgi:hypothetical protein
VGGDDAEEILSDRKQNDGFAQFRALQRMAEGLVEELEDPYGDPYGINEHTLGVRSGIDDQLLLIDNFGDIGEEEFRCFAKGLP